MAKMWGVSKEKRALEYNKQHFRKVSEHIEKEQLQKNKKEPQLGIKFKVMLVYAEKGKLSAWKELQEYNNKLSGEGFTLEMLEQWIDEYEKKQSQKNEKDDGFDR